MTRKLTGKSSAKPIEPVSGSAAASQESAKTQSICARPAAPSAKSLLASARTSVDSGPDSATSKPLPEAAAAWPPRAPLTSTETVSASPEPSELPPSKSPAYPSPLQASTITPAISVKPSIGSSQVSSPQGKVSPASAPSSPDADAAGLSVLSVKSVQPPEKVSPLSGEAVSATPRAQVSPLSPEQKQTSQGPTISSKTSTVLTSDPVSTPVGYREQVTPSTDLGPLTLVVAVPADTVLTSVTIDPTTGNVWSAYERVPPVLEKLVETPGKVLPAPEKIKSNTEPVEKTLLKAKLVPGKSRPVPAEPVSASARFSQEVEITPSVSVKELLVGAKPISAPAQRSPALNQLSPDPAGLSPDTVRLSQQLQFSSSDLNRVSTEHEKSPAESSELWNNRDLSRSLPDSVPDSVQMSGSAEQHLAVAKAVLPTARRLKFVEPSLTSTKNESPAKNKGPDSEGISSVKTLAQKTRARAHPGKLRFVQTKARALQTKGRVVQQTKARTMQGKARLPQTKATRIFQTKARGLQTKARGRPLKTHVKLGPAKATQTFSNDSSETTDVPKDTARAPPSIAKALPPSLDSMSGVSGKDSPKQLEQVPSESPQSRVVSSQATPVTVKALHITPRLGPMKSSQALDDGPQAPEPLVTTPAEPSEVSSAPVEGSPASTPAQDLSVSPDWVPVNASQVSEQHSGSETGSPE